jgi:predicted ester cyclase
LEFSATSTLAPPDLFNTLGRLRDGYACSGQEQCAIIHTGAALTGATHAGRCAIGTAENKALIRRVFDEIWNRGQLERIEELFAPQFVRHGAPTAGLTGPAGERQHRAAHRQAFPDLVITADDLVAEGERVAVRYTWRGTYQGSWPDVPQPGIAVTMTGIAIHRVVAGTITDLWVVGDELGLLQQLGVVPTRGPTPAPGPPSP